jgi:hypothetical protein
MSIVMRRLDSGPESQVVIRVSSDGLVDARSYRVRNGNAHAIAVRYKRLIGTEDIKRIAALIQVDERRMTVAASETNKWQFTLLEAIEGSVIALRRTAEQYRKDGTETVVLHGALYELWYVDGPVSAYWSFIDISPDNAVEQSVLPLSRWINMVMDEVGATRQE